MDFHSGSPVGKLLRFFLPPEYIQGETAVLTPSVSRHAVGTLRLRSGEELVLFDGTGIEYRAILQREKSGYTARIVERIPGFPPVKPRITLYQAAIKKEPWEWLLQKATELGVSTLVPLLTRYVEVNAAQQFPKRKERWEAILQSACEQSGRSFLPELSSPITLEAALKEAAGLKLFFYEGKPVLSLREVLAAEEPVESCSVFIGPEGGFSQEEVSRARAAEARVVSLGPLILRAETAGLAALAVLSFWFGEKD